MVVSLRAEGYMVIFIQITIKGKAMAVWYFSLSHSVMSKSFDLLGYLLVQYVYHMTLATGSKEICHCTLISPLCN